MQTALFDEPTSVIGPGRKSDLRRVRKLKVRVCIAQLDQTWQDVQMASSMKAPI